MKTGVSIGKCKVRGVSKWRVRWRELGRIKRKFFTGRASAESHAAFLRGEQLTARQRLLTLPADDLERLLALLDQKKVDDGLKSVSLAKVINELLQVKLASGVSSRHVENVRWMLNTFARGRESLPVSAITLADIESFIASKNLPSRPCWRGRISNLIKFSVRRGYRADNPCLRLEPIRVPHVPPAVMTLKQVGIALNHLRKQPQILAWFVLSTFAGLRPEEADKTAWTAIDFGEKLIRVEAQTSKIRQRRVIYPPPMVFDWLAFAKKKRSVLPVERTARIFYLKPLKKKMGIKIWPRDFTRHTCASMLVASIEDVGKVATMLGNSPSVLLKHYKALVTKIDAEKFWAISPAFQTAAAAQRARLLPPRKSFAVPASVKT